MFSAAILTLHRAYFARKRLLRGVPRETWLFLGRFCGFSLDFSPDAAFKDFWTVSPPCAILGGVVTTVALQLRRAVCRRASLWGGGGSWVLGCSSSPFSCASIWPFTAPWSPFPLRLPLLAPASSFFWGLFPLFCAFVVFLRGFATQVRGFCALFRTTTSSAAGDFLAFCVFFTLGRGLPLVF